MARYIVTYSPPTPNWTVHAPNLDAAIQAVRHVAAGAPCCAGVPQGDRCIDCLSDAHGRIA